MATTSVAAAAHPYEVAPDLEAWSSRVIEAAIAVAHGEVSKVDAIDGAWAEAERAGLVVVFGADEIQAALSLAFGALWR